MSVISSQIWVERTLWFSHILYPSLFLGLEFVGVEIENGVHGLCMSVTFMRVSDSSQA